MKVIIIEIWIGTTYLSIFYLCLETHLLDNAFVAAESSYFPQLMAQLFVVIAFAKSCLILVNWHT